MTRAKKTKATATTATAKKTKATATTAKKTTATAKKTKATATTAKKTAARAKSARKETLTVPIAAESVGGLEPPPDSRFPSDAPTVASEPPGKQARARVRPARLDPDPSVVAQIRELEAQLDRLIDEASRHDVSSLDPDDLDTVEVEDGSDLEETVHDGRASAGAVGSRAPSAPAGDDDLDDEDEDDVAADADAAFDAEETMPTARGEAGFAPPSASGRIFGSERDVSRESVPPPPESVFDTARELLSTDFYLRKWGRLAMRGRSEEVDDFGLDPIYEDKLRPMLDFLYAKYFRVETSGIENVPAEGRCLLVANHSGTLPLDGLMIKTAVKREHPAARDVRWLTEDFISHMPFLGGAMNRLGAVRACQENAERLLAKEELVAVFPEGVKGIGKLFAERYRLQRFGRGGFIKLCLRMSTPIVPVAVVGAEETNPMLFRVEALSKAFGVPYVPVTPTFPLLGPLGLVPAPTKWRIMFGEPLDLSAHGPEAADDELLVGKLAERVRASIQGMLDRAVGSRKSVFFG